MSGSNVIATALVVFIEIVMIMTQFRIKFWNSTTKQTVNTSTNGDQYAYVLWQLAIFLQVDQPFENTNINTA